MSEGNEEETNENERGEKKKLLACLAALKKKSVRTTCQHSIS